MVVEYFDFKSFGSDCNNFLSIVDNLQILSILWNVAIYAFFQIIYFSEIGSSIGTFEKSLFSMHA